MITDIDGNLVITEAGWNHPVIVYGASRAAIDLDPNKAKKLRDQTMRWKKTGRNAPAEMMGGAGLRLPPSQLKHILSLGPL